MSGQAGPSPSLARHKPDIFLTSRTGCSGIRGEGLPSGFPLSRLFLILGSEVPRESSIRSLLSLSPKLTASPLSPEAASVLVSAAFPSWAASASHSLPALIPSRSAQALPWGRITALTLFPACPRDWSNRVLSKPAELRDLPANSVLEGFL